MRIKKKKTVTKAQEWRMDILSINAAALHFVGSIFIRNEVNTKNCGLDNQG